MSQTVVIENKIPNKLDDCTSYELIDIISNNIDEQHRSKLIQFVKENNLNGASFQSVSDDQLAELLGIDEWEIYYKIHSKLNSEFAHSFRIPFVQNTDHKDVRYIAEIEKKTLNLNTFTIINNHNGDNNDIHLQFASSLTPLQLIEFLINILQDIISKEIIEIIVSYYPYKESIVGVSWSFGHLSNEILDDLYSYLNEMGTKSMDIRPLPSGTWSSKTCGKVQDIIDPSLFVARVKNNYQWIPSTVEIMDEKTCTIRIISSINKYERNVKDLFVFYESVISEMLPHFEDVTQQKLIKQGKKLQIICKALQYRMAKGSIYGTHWHYDGIKEVEHVIAVGILYTKNELPDSGMLEFAVNGSDLSDYRRKEVDGDGKHFALSTKKGTCIVWNNEQMQHRLGFLDNNGYGRHSSEDNEESDASNEKIRQAVICMLVDPNIKIITENADDFKIDLAEAKKRREIVREKRKGDISRQVPYCGDCGAYGHWHNGPGGFPSKPTVFKFISTP